MKVETLPFLFDEFDHSHAIVENTDALGTCWYCAVREYQCKLTRSLHKSISKEKYLYRCIEQALIPEKPMWWWEIVDGQRVLMHTGTREYSHNEPSQNSRGVALPFFMGLHPRSTRRFYSLYKHDQRQRKARTGTVYQPTVPVYWYLDMKKPVSNAGFVYVVGRKENPNSEDAVCAVLTNGDYTTNTAPAVEAAKYVPSTWCKRIVKKPEPVEPVSVPKSFPALEPEKKPRRLSGNLSRAEMKRVLMSEESIREITAHVAQMLHIYSIQQQGGTQKQFGAEWNGKSKWGKREMDEMVMSFVTSGLHAYAERINLDGRKRNLTRTFKERKPIRFSGGKDAFISGAKKWIAESCKERELWWGFRDVQMTPTDQNAVSTEAASEIDLDRLYMSKRDEETAAWDRERTGELITASYSDDDIPEETQHAVSHSLFDDDDDSVIVHGEWMYSRSDEPLPFNRMVDRYIGPKLVDVPWWER